MMFSNQDFQEMKELHKLMNRHPFQAYLFLLERIGQHQRYSRLVDDLDSLGGRIWDALRAPTKVRKGASSNGSVPVGREVQGDTPAPVQSGGGVPSVQREVGT